MSEKDIEIINKIKKILTYALNEGIPYQVAGGYISGKIKGYSRTGVTSKDLLYEGDIVRKLFKEEGLDWKKVKEFVKKRNIDINIIIDELNKGEYVEVPLKREREEKSMINVENRLHQVIKDLSFEGFNEFQIKKIMKFGPDCIESSDEKMIVEKIFKDNGIESNDLLADYGVEPEVYEVEPEEVYEDEPEEVYEAEPEEVYEDESEEDYEDELDDFDYEDEYENKDSNKRKKEMSLEEKIFDLYDKIDKEKSLFKRHIYQFKVRGLIAKLQKEIDRQNIKKEYALKRERLAYKIERKESNLLEKIAEEQKYIKSLEQILIANAEYDYESEDFIYPRSYTEKIGGVDGVIKKLQESHNMTSQYTAKKIAEISELRAHFTQEKDELKELKKELDNLDLMYAKEEKEEIIEEKKMILAQNNPLKNFKDMISVAIIEIKAFLADRKEYIALKAKEREKIKKIEEIYKKMQEEDKMKIKEQYVKKQKEMNYSKVRAFQEEARIKVSEEQFADNDFGEKSTRIEKEDNEIYENAPGVEPGDE